jgi:hypothetical protein
MRGAVMKGICPFASRVAAILAAPFVVALAIPSARAAEANDYPTEARADYVFGCMAANGQDQLALHKCSCSIDVIASILPYKRYVDAETVLSMRQGIGQPANAFRGVGVYNDMVADLRRAQAEAEIRCFE